MTGKENRAQKRGRISSAGCALLSPVRTVRVVQHLCVLPVVSAEGVRELRERDARLRVRVGVVRGRTGGGDPGRQ